MRSKTPLALMEQLVMILVFALAAVMCVRMFVLADRLSRRNEAVSQAALLSQNVAEEIKSCGGRLTEILDTDNWEVGEGCWVQAFDKDWQKISAGEEKETKYRIEVWEQDSEIPGLLRAEILATEAGEELFRIPVAWQEVYSHE